MISNQPADRLTGCGLAQPEACSPNNLLSPRDQHSHVQPCRRKKRLDLQTSLTVITNALFLSIAADDGDDVRSGICEPIGTAQIGDICAWPDLVSNTITLLTSSCFHNASTHFQAVHHARSSAQTRLDVYIYLYSLDVLI